MKAKDIFNIKNIASFVEGHAMKFYDNLVGLPEHTKDQILYRLFKCKDDCLIVGKCQHCGCPPEDRAFTSESCNKGERFPDLMNKEDWDKYKKGLDDYK